MNQSKTDRIFQSPFEKISDFRFDAGVVEVFEDMIERSVPGYAAILGMTGELAQQFAQPHSILYDLGCSLGGSSLSIAQHDLPEGIEIIALDNSQPMVDQFEKKLQGISGLEVPIIVRREDICATEFKASSFVALNFTLQFIAPELRADLIGKIFQAMLPGGALLLSEKIRFEDQGINNLMIDLHHQFKKAKGYSDLEIAQKRTAIEKILLPETAEAHLNRLHQAGFGQATCWFQCFNFCSFLAIKSL